MKAFSLLPPVFYKIRFWFPGGPRTHFFRNCAFYVSDKGFEKRTRKKNRKKSFCFCACAPDLCRGAPPRETAYCKSAGVRGRSPRETVANIYDSERRTEQNGTRLDTRLAISRGERRSKIPNGPNSRLQGRGV